MSTSKKIIDIVPQEIRQQCPSYEDYVNFCRNQQPIFVPYIPVMPHTLLCQVQPDKNDLVDFNFFNIEGIRGYYKELDNGELIRLVNAEDIAIGAGLDKKEIDRRRPVGPHVGRQSTEYLEYNKIRWDRFNQYAEDSLEFLREVVSPSVFGYTTNRNENGIVNTYWTANGRWFINIVLERYGIFKDKDNTSIVNTLLID